MLYEYPPSVYPILPVWFDNLLISVKQFRAILWQSGQTVDYTESSGKVITLWSQRCVHLSPSIDLIMKPSLELTRLQACHDVIHIRLLVDKMVAVLRPVPSAKITLQSLSHHRISHRLREHPTRAGRSTETSWYIRCRGLSCSRRSASQFRRKRALFLLEIP